MIPDTKDNSTLVSLLFIVGILFAVFVLWYFST
jgi:hypothetical protein